MRMKHEGKEANAPAEKSAKNCECHDGGRGQYHLPGCALYVPEIREGWTQEQSGQIGLALKWEVAR